MNGIKIFSIMQKIGITLFNTFDESAVELLENLDTCIQTASFEITVFPNQNHSRNQKPILMSTGMATLEEIGEAVEAINSSGNHK